MTNFDTLCTMAEEIPADLYREVLREKAGRVLPALEAAAGSRERAETVFAAFIIASVYCFCPICGRPSATGSAFPM